MNINNSDLGKVNFRGEYTHHKETIGYYKRRREKLICDKYQKKRNINIWEEKSSFSFIFVFIFLIMINFDIFFF